MRIRAHHPPGNSPVTFPREINARGPSFGHLAFILISYSLFLLPEGLSRTKYGSTSIVRSTCALCFVHRFLFLLGFSCGSDKSIALILRSTTCINQAETFYSVYIHDGKRDFTRQIVILRPQVVPVVRHCAAFDRLGANRSILFVMMTVISGRANPCRARSECAQYKAQRVRSTYTLCTSSARCTACRVFRANTQANRQHVPVHR